jgi:hypothetical protein
MRGEDSPCKVLNLLGVKSFKGLEQDWVREMVVDQDEVVVVAPGCPRNFRPCSVLAKRGPDGVHFTYRTVVELFRSADRPGSPSDTADIRAFEPGDGKVLRGFV